MVVGRLFLQPQASAAVTSHREPASRDCGPSSLADIVTGNPGIALAIERVQLSAQIVPPLPAHGWAIKSALSATPLAGEIYCWLELQLIRSSPRRKATASEASLHDTTARRHVLWMRVALVDVPAHSRWMRAAPVNARSAGGPVRAQQPPQISGGTPGPSHLGGMRQEGRRRVVRGCCRGGRGTQTAP